jgi:membrane associated rhomboid family serine protease
VTKFRISYNAPVVLTFALAAVIVRLLGDGVTGEWFTTHGNLSDGLPSYVTLFTHIIGHGNWDHLLGNFMLILLLGPILEERYGSLSLLIMIAITAVISGFVDIALGDRTLGASGIVFMMIVLASTANIRAGAIPLTFIAVALLFVGAEVIKAFNKDNISQLSHILGGVIGGAFGFLGAKAKLPNLPLPGAVTQRSPAAAVPPGRSHSSKGP